ncbi:hypothetical protein JHK82_013466 [Glycine max]|uniref:Putative ribonuclease H protein n=1 Tax=Glycine soja TaxID=3848 RepID=A0A0B2Q742_GLYSO|nr:hypothetical protein JHK85_013835 [Glycine max]KAG5058487.1 hypothetical protein JHK86_013483 [Glycine max]KAG5155497.1 hypothetical protein JHK82_013466 [Glycine max]KHN17441.1 Putative ribonuclease H protein [Glycine soja]
MGGEVSLIARYPRLYVISSQQNHIIQHMGVFRDKGWEWDFRWRRPLFDNEIDMAVSFLREVEGHRIQPQQGDQWVWKADPSGQYTAKSAYGVLWGEMFEEQQDGVFEELWKLKLPSKITIFAWRLIRDRLPTRSNLRRKQIEVDDPRCPFCRSAEESAAHLFFHCSRIAPVWWESLSWVNLLGVFPNHPRQHFLQHIYGVTAGMRASRWKWWWLALTWTIWKQRNNMIFSNGTFNANKILDEAIFLIWTWLTHLEKDFSIHYNQWSSNIRAAFSNSDV